MIREFALEPEMLKSELVQYYLRSNVGVCKGQFISKCPKNWSNAVAAWPKIRELYIALDRRKAFRDFDRQVDWDNAQSWSENIEQNKEQIAFDVIIQSEAIKALETVVTLNNWPDKEDLLDRDNHLFARIPKRADEIARVLGSLGKISSKLMFADPYLYSAEDRFLNVYFETLNVSKVSQKTTVELHTKFSFKDQGRNKSWEMLSKPDLENQLHLAKQRFEKSLLPRLNQFSDALSINVYVWGEREGGTNFHDRYFLTELGGMKLGAGTDEATTNQTKGHEVNIDHLKKQEWEHTTNRLHPDATFYEKLSAWTFGRHAK